MRETLPVPGRMPAAWGSGRPNLELGEEAREEVAMTDGAGRGPSKSQGLLFSEAKKPYAEAVGQRRLYSGSTPVDDGAKSVSESNGQ